MANCTGASTLALLFTILAGGFCIFSFSTDHWSDYKTLGVPGHRGLVNDCTEILGIQSCTQWVKEDNAPDYVRGCLAAMVLGFLAIAAAAVVWILWMMACCNSGAILTVLKVITVILQTIGLGLVILAVIVFAAKDKGDSIRSIMYTDYKLFWSWGLAILAGIFQIIAVTLTCGAGARQYQAV